MKSICVGFIGFANSHQKDWLEHFHRHPDVEVVAISDCSPFGTYGGQDHAQRLGVDYYRDYRNLLERSDVDVVSIGSETALHAEHTIAACQAGKHIFYDKPFADTLENGRAIVKAVESAGVKFFMGFHLRLDPIFRRVRQMLRDGTLGPARHIDLVGEWGRSATIHTPWVHTPEAAGGGALINFGVHGLDLIRYWTGDEVAEVYAELGYRTYPEYPVEDAAVVQMRLRGGASVSLVAGWGKPLERHTHAYDAHVEVRGQYRTLRADFSAAQHLEVCSEATPYDRTTWITVGDYQDIRAEAVDMFVAYINGEGQPLASLEDGYRNAELVEAAYRAARQRQPVTLPLVD
jgi:myo-inositol 2-dehydrogenase/D-chiro-inositol 1-dehydrogenase